ncbi:MAG: hypothetical protein WCE21_01755 [Candidatus Babeliales bacterium]
MRINETIREYLQSILLIGMCTACTPIAWGAEQLTKISEELYEWDALQSNESAFEEFLFTSLPLSMVLETDSVTYQIDTKTESEGKKYYCPYCVVAYFNLHEQHTPMNKNILETFAIHSLSTFHAHLNDTHSIEGWLAHIKIACKNGCSKKKLSKKKENGQDTIFTGYHSWIRHFRKSHYSEDIKLDPLDKSCKRKTQSSAKSNNDSKKQKLESKK